MAIHFTRYKGAPIKGANQREFINKLSFAIYGKDFLDDKEKMKDFYLLSKEEFLSSYSYMTEEEYNATQKKIRGK